MKLHVTYPRYCMTCGKKLEPSYSPVLGMHVHPGRRRCYDCSQLRQQSLIALNNRRSRRTR